MKPYYLTSKIFPFSTKQATTLPKEQVRKLGMLYSAYRIIISVFLFMSSYVVKQGSDDVITVTLPSFLQQSVLIFYGLFSVLLFCFFFFIRNNDSKQLGIGLTFDIVFISFLLYINGAADLQLVMLYMVVVAASFMLLLPYQAILITMMAIIVVIYQQLFQALSNSFNFNYLGEALLICVSFLCVAVLSWTLTQRLAQVEELAQKTADEIAKLNAITQEVIKGMQQGVIVLNSNKHVILMNYAASQMLDINLQSDENKCNFQNNKENKKAELGNHTKQNFDSHGLFSIEVEKTAVSSFLAEHPALNNWLNNVITLAQSQLAQSQLIYETPQTNINYDKLRLTSTPMQDDIVLIMLEDLRREQTNAQQLKLASLGQLTASIAHEVRNPLATISQASQLLMDDEDWVDEEDWHDNIDQSTESNSETKRSDPNAELYQMIFQQTKRVNQIIEDVLKLSRQAKPEQSKLIIVEWLTEFIENHFRHHDVFLHPFCDASCYFDPNQLEQILINLINNGLRFSSKSHPHAYVEIEINCDQNNVIIDVLDTGEGVSEDKLENLFMPFFTTDNEGTGLGLYLSQAFAEANYSRLIYVPEHKNTCFRLMIPLAISDDQTLA